MTGGVRILFKVFLFSVKWNLCINLMYIACKLKNHYHPEQIFSGIKKEKLDSILFKIFLIPNES